MNVSQPVKWTLGLGLVLMGGLLCLEYFALSESMGPVKRTFVRTNPGQGIHVPGRRVSLSAATDSSFRPRPERAEAIKAGPEADTGHVNLQAWADGIGAADMPAALQYLQDHEFGDTGLNVLTMLIRRWAQGDARAAARWVEQMPAGEARRKAMDAVAIIWANQELAAAIDWVSQAPEGDERQGAVKSVAYEAARTAPLAALQLAFEIPASAGRDALIRHATLQWASSDPAMAAAWADQIADAKLREQILAGIATVWGDVDLMAAAKLVECSIAPGRQQDNAVVGIVQRWAQKAPEISAACVEQFPDGNAKQAALENVVKLWAEKDVQQVVNWLNSLPDGSTRDTAAAVFSTWLTPASPALAARWAECIGADSARSRQMAWVAQWL